MEVYSEEEEQEGEKKRGNDREAGKAFLSWFCVRHGRSQDLQTSIKI